MTNLIKDKKLERIGLTILIISIMLILSFMIIPSSNRAFADTYTDFDIITGFGYNGSTYYWNGAIDLEVDTVNYKFENGMHKFKPGIGLKFKIHTTGKVNNAFNQMSGAITLTMNGTPKECGITVGIGEKVTLTNNEMTFTTQTIPGTYQMTVHSNIVRKDWRDIDDIVFTYQVEDWQ